MMNSSRSQGQVEAEGGVIWSRLIQQGLPAGKGHGFGC